MHSLPQRDGEGNPASDPAPCGPPVVAFKDAGGSALGGRTIWEHASFQIRPGEFIAMIGPNGCGKSSLLRMILGQVPASAGDIQVLGGPPRLGNRAVGLVPQRRELTSGLAIRGRDLVLLGIEGSYWGFGRPSAAAQRQADWALEAVHAEFADEPMGVLSGGELQRLIIAQACRRNSRSCCSTSLWPASISAASTRSYLWWTVSDTVRASPCCSSATTSTLCCPCVDRVLYFLNRCPVCGGVDEVVEPELLSHLFGTPIQVCRTHEGGRLVHGAIHRRRNGHIP